MPGASLTRRVRFRATHRYYKPGWSEEKNRATFGACAAPEPHGHDYSCDVSFRGTIDASTGMVVDLGLVDRILDEQIVLPLNDRSLNEAIPEFAPGELIPTCEELARIIAQRVGAALAKAGGTATVDSVRVAEDETLSASWSPER